jgi:hypothetical protein
MIHVTQATRDKLEPLLQKIRSLNVLKEKARGVFYYKSKAFLHFHEDEAGIFADLKEDDRWRRRSVDSKADKSTLIKAIMKAVNK